MKKKKSKWISGLSISHTFLVMNGEQDWTIDFTVRQVHFYLSEDKYRKED